jgi:hypothetical protein
MSAVTQPPTPWLLGYRLLGLRLPEQHRAWVAEDVASRGYLTWRVVRTALWGLAALGLYVLGQSAMWQQPARRTVIRIALLLLAYALLASRSTLVRRTLRWQRVDKHGRPVRPKGMATLGNAEAALVVALAAILVTAGSAVFGYGLRPSGAAVAPCRKPDATLAAELKSGFKNPAASLVSPQVVKFNNGVVVATFFTTPEKKQPTFAAFIVDHGTVYELRAPDNAKGAATTFPPPKTTDRISVEALQRAVTCLGKGGPR